MSVSPRCNHAGPLGQRIPTGSLAARLLSHWQAQARARLRW